MFLLKTGIYIKYYTLNLLTEISQRFFHKLIVCFVKRSGGNGSVACEIFHNKVNSVVALIVKEGALKEGIL